MRNIGQIIGNLHQIIAVCTLAIVNGKEMRMIEKNTSAQLICTHRRCQSPFK